jgi:hypothetical protein
MSRRFGGSGFRPRPPVQKKLPNGKLGGHQKPGKGPGKGGPQEYFQKLDPRRLPIVDPEPDRPRGRASVVQRALTQGGLSSRAGPPLVPLRRCRGADIVRRLDRVYQVHEVHKDSAELIDFATGRLFTFEPAEKVYLLARLEVE